MTTFSFDSDYVRRLAEGDPPVEEHFTAYFGQLLSLKLRGRVRSAPLAEDIRQETFLRVLRQIRSDRGIDNLPAFVNGTCNKVMLELFRSDSRHPQLPEPAADPADDTVDLEGALVDEERKGIVRSILAELSADDRIILRKVFLEERDKDEVCANMHVSRGYLRVLLHRARKRLKERLMKRESARKMGAVG